MTGRRAVLLLLAVSLALPATAGPALAQAGNNSTTGGDVQAEQVGEQIDQDTVLVNATYDPDAGTVTVTLRSERLQEITVTDAGAFLEGGEVAQRTVTVRPDTTTQITVPVTEAEEFVGVSIATSSTLYAVPIEVEESMFSGDPTWSTVRVAGLGALSGGLLALGLGAWRRKGGGREEARRIA